MRSSWSPSSRCPNLEDVGARRARRRAAARFSARLSKPTTPLWHSPVRQLLVVAGLTGFAVSQPLLSILGDEPAIIAFHGVHGRELVLFAAAVALLPPLVLWGGPYLVQLLQRSVGRAVHLGVVGVLFAAFLVQVLKPATPPALTVASAIVGGLAFVALYARHAAVSAWASYTCVLPVLALGSFLFASPASDLLSTPTSAPEAEGSAPSVVMIVLDELPTRSLLDETGGIDRIRFPNLAGFAAHATWYRHHTSQATATESAVPSLLTGRHPEVKAPLHANYPENLFTLLAPTHELEVFETATDLCPYEECAPTGEGTGVLETGPGFAELIDVTRDLWHERVEPDDAGAPALDDFAQDVEAISVRADAFASTFDTAKGPSLYYLHLMLPHQPWRHEADGTLYSESDRFGLSLNEADRLNTYSWSPWVGTVSEQRHLLQAQYTDRVLGRVLDALQVSGLYDSSLVVVTADHGVSFEEDHPGRRITESTVDALAYTPLIMKEPQQRDGVVDDSNVLSLDVVPTIAGAVGVDPPWEVDGAAVGSDAIRERGTEKSAYDVAGLGEMSIAGIIAYDDVDTFATVDDRWIGPLSDPADPLSAMNDLLDLDGVLGARLSDLPANDEPGSGVLIHYLDQIEHPAAAPLTAISGIIDDPPSDGVGLLAINGVVVGGSELSTDGAGTAGRLQFLIPARVLEASNEVRVALLADGRVTELEVR